MRIIKRNGESIGRSSPLFVSPAQSAATKTCSEKLDEDPWYRCSRRRKHLGDHAAHAGHGAKCVMVARWDNVNGNDNETLRLARTTGVTEKEHDK